MQGLVRLAVTMRFYVKMQKSASHIKRHSWQPQKGQPFWRILDEGIPCNLAPVHFTVHVVQVRLNFALGFAHEANPLFETGFSPGCPSSVLISLPARLARWGRGRQEINPDPLLLWLSSFSFPSGLCTEEEWFGRRFGSREDGFPLSKKYHRRHFRFYTVFEKSF